MIAPQPSVISNVQSRQRRLELVLAVCALAAAGCLAWLDSISTLAGALRSQSPIAALICVRSQDQGREIPPDLHAAIYVPSSSKLEIISLPASTQVPSLSGGPSRNLAGIYRASYSSNGDLHRASRAMAENSLQRLRLSRSWPPDASTFSPIVEIEIPTRGQEAPSDIKNLLFTQTRGPRFWLRLWKQPSALRAQITPALSHYDQWLLAWTLRRLDPARVHASVLPQAALIDSFLGRVFAHDLSVSSLAEPPTVEILNASDSPGVAWQATKVLRWQGIDVVRYANAPRKERFTRFIDRSGDPHVAQSVRRALDCPEAEVITDMKKDPQTAVTVILGGNFTRCLKLN